MARTLVEPDEPCEVVVAKPFSFELANAAHFDALRPDYEPEAVAWVAERGSLGERSRVVDLAAGTGRLSKRLLLLGAKLIAVEPARNMCAVIQQRLPEVRVTRGSAETIPLGDGTAEAVVVGNALLHFDLSPAFAEILRVLRPDGSLALLWAWPTEEGRAAYPALQQVN